MLAHLSMFNMEKRYRNKIIIIIINLWSCQSPSPRPLLQLAGGYGLNMQ